MNSRPSISFAVKAALVVCAAGVAFHGATKSGGGKLNAKVAKVAKVAEREGCALLRPHGDEASSLVAATVTNDDIARGWRLESVETNGAAFFEMPTNAVVYEPWTLRGGRETWFPLDFGDFAFPLGTDAVHRVRVKSGGETSTFRQNAPSAICAAAEWASLIPGVSRFWCADADGGAAKVLTWERVFANRDRTGEYSAQITLRRNGDFTTQSNDVRRVYRRVNPCDWDGDGLANDVDSNPTAYDGDFFGAANALPDGANTGAYCTVDLVVYGADALVEFAGDGASNYPDPCFVARAEATNEIEILIGKTYDVSSTQPFAVVGVSDAATVVEATDGGYRIVRPVTIEAVDLSAQPQAQTQSAQRRALLAASASATANTSSASGGGVFTMSVDPANLGGVFAWNDSCCGVAFDGGVFSFVENSACTCLGCRASGAYVYEGYSIPVYGGWCCRLADEPKWSGDCTNGAVGVSASFSTGAVLFERSYQNTPGEWHPGKSTKTRLDICADGGPNGGVLSVETRRLDKLRKLAGAAPPSAPVEIPPRCRVTYSAIYEAAFSSDAIDDVGVHCAVADGDTGEERAAYCRLTSVEVALTATVAAPSNACPNRHVFGVHEEVSVSVKPSAAPFTLAVDGSPDFVHFEGKSFWCPWSGGNCGVSVSCMGETLDSQIRVFEPEPRAAFAEWNGNAGSDGCAGMVRMNLELVLHPMTVSFGGLSMMEIPDESESCARAGYFADPDRGRPWSHTQAAGAGVWSIVSMYNEWTHDGAGTGRSYPTPWSAGWKEWDIPVGWGTYEGGERKIKGVRRPNPTTQKFEIDADGTVTVRKYGHWIRRSVDNKIWLDGKRVN